MNRLYRVVLFVVLLLGLFGAFHRTARCSGSR